MFPVKVLDFVIIHSKPKAFYKESENISHLYGAFFFFFGPCLSILISKAGAFLS